MNHRCRVYIIILKTIFMSLGPFEAKNGKISFKGNKVFHSIDDVKNIYAPDLSQRHMDLVLNGKKWKNLVLIFNGLKTATESFMKQDGALAFDLPITTRMISSPGALNGTIPSDVDPFRLNFFGKETFLTQSSQLYLEFAINISGIDKVYCFDKSFRMEKADFRHLPEFTHIEYEGHTDFGKNIEIQEKYLKYVIKYLCEKCEDSLMFFLTDQDFEELKNLANINRFERITFTEAFELLRKMTNDTKYSNVSIRNFTAYEEILLTQFFKNKPVFVTHFIADEVAFYHALDKNNPALAVNADLLFPGYGEIIGSGERINTRSDTEKKAKHFQLNMNDYRAYIESRDVNNPRIHSGWGMGVERFIQALLKLPFIWETKAFPRVDNSDRP